MSGTPRNTGSCEPTWAAVSDEAAVSVPLHGIFRKVDEYLAKHVESYHFDVDAGLAELEQRGGSSAPARLGECTDSARGEPPSTDNGEHFENHRRSAERLDKSSREYSFLDEVLRASMARAAHDAVEWFESHRGPAVPYLAALRATPVLIRSRNTDAFAARLASVCGGERWLVNWMPEVVLTRKQVYSIMVLDEILVAHDLDSNTMLSVMRGLAGDVYLPLEKVLRRLSRVKYPPPRPEWLRAWDHKLVDPAEAADAGHRTSSKSSRAR